MPSQSINPLIELGLLPTISDGDNNGRIPIDHNLILSLRPDTDRALQTLCLSLSDAVRSLSETVGIVGRVAAIALVLFGAARVFGEMTTVVRRKGGKDCDNDDAKDQA